MTADRVEAGQMEADRVEGHRVEGHRVEGHRVEGSPAGGRRVEAAWPDDARPEDAQVASGRAEAGRTGADRVEPGTVRPGGRTARVRAAVLRAAGDALVEHGFHRLDLADVARRAEVGKTTVYRRWGTPTGLIADLLADMAEQSLPRADTGSLAGDLEANARLVLKTLTDPRQGPLFKAVIAAAACDERAAEALHRFYATRIEEWAPCVARAVERGELPAGTDPAEVIRAVSAPLYYRLLASGDPLDEAAADRAATAAAAAARAGTYVTA